MSEERAAGEGGGRSWTSRALIGVAVAAGVALAGAGAAVASGRALVRSDRSRPRQAGELELPEDIVHHSVATPDGGRLHVVERGAGDPVVLLHGVTLSSRIWPYQLRSLPEAGMRVLAVDQRGHGRSRPGDDGTTVPAMIEDLAMLLEHFDLRDVTLVGHSMGSMVVTGYARAHRETFEARVRAVALIGATAGLALPLPPGLRVEARTAVALAGALGLIGRRRPELLPRGDVGYVLSRVAFGVEPQLGHVELTLDLVRSMDRRYFGDLLPTLLGFNAWDWVPSIEVPALVTVSPRDRITGEWAARRLVSSLPHSLPLDLPGAGHMPMLERHAVLDKALIKLVEMTRGDAPPAAVGGAGAPGRGRRGR